jgi:hypothetical protein
MGMGSNIWTLAIPVPVWQEWRVEVLPVAEKHTSGPRDINVSWANHMPVLVPVMMWRCGDVSSLTLVVVERRGREIEGWWVGIINLVMAAIVVRIKGFVSKKKDLTKKNIPVAQETRGRLLGHSFVLVIVIFSLYSPVVVAIDRLIKYLNKLLVRWIVLREKRKKNIPLVPRDIVVDVSWAFRMLVVMEW